MDIPVIIDHQPTAEGTRGGKSVSGVDDGRRERERKIEEKKGKEKVGHLPGRDQANGAGPVSVDRRRLHGRRVPDESGDGRLGAVDQLRPHSARFQLHGVQYDLHRAFSIKFESNSSSVDQLTQGARTARSSSVTFMEMLRLVAHCSRSCRSSVGTKSSPWQAVQGAAPQVVGSLPGSSKRKRKRRWWCTRSVSGS